MQIKCPSCGYAINRDIYVDGVVVEEYKNIYGTHCPSCGYLIKSDKINRISEERENSRLKFASIILDKIRKKILGEK